MSTKGTLHTECEQCLVKGDKSYGSMTVEITQRNAGEIETAFKIRSYREGDELITNVYDSTGTCVATHKTPY